MDDQQFDSFAKTLAGGLPRRSRRRRFSLFVLVVLLTTTTFLAAAAGSSRAQESTPAVLRFYDIFNSGNFDALGEIVAPDFVDHNPVPGQAPGLDGLTQALTLFRTGFPDGQITIDDVVVEADKVVTRTTFRGTHQGVFLGIPPSGQPVQFAAIDIWRIEGGLIVEVWHIEDLLNALIQVGALPAPGAPQAELSASPVAGQVGSQTIVAAGLTNPRGMAWGADGALYVALAGVGGPTPGDPPIPAPLDPFMGGPTGAVARIVDGCPVAVATGLPSSDVGGQGSIGIGDLVFLDGQLYALGAGGTKDGGNPGTANALYRIEADGSATLVADLSAFVLANPPAVAPPEGVPNPGNPYAMAVVGDRFWVADAVLGLILTVTPDGAVELLVDVSSGHPVPTGIAPAPDGGAYVGYLTALPYSDGAAKVVHISPEGVVTDAWTGLTAVTSVAVGPDGTLYAVELSTGNTDEPPFIVPGSGRVVRQTGPDSLDVVADGLMLPVSVDVGPDGALYLASPAVGADHGEGTIVRLDATGAVPAPPPACAPIPETLAPPHDPAATPAA